jgi:hypothetical protein
MTKAKRKRSDGADAFIPESAQSSGTTDDLAELLAEQYLRSAGGDETEEDTRDEVVPEELGGPFVETASNVEFGRTRSTGTRSVKRKRAATDPLRSPLPQAVGALAIAAPDEEVEAEDGEAEEDALAAALAADPEARAEAEPASRVEPDIKVDALPSGASRT